MALFYQGPRPVLRGRNAKNNINPYTGKVEKFSNWSIFNTEHIWDGAPNTAVQPGAGLYPHGLNLSRVFRGLENKEQPLDGPGLGPRLDGARYNPLLSRSAGNNKVFKSAYGHAPDTPVSPSGQLYWYSNFKFHGLRQPLAAVGHAARNIGAAGTANSFGRFLPENPDPTRKDPLTGVTYGQALPVDNTNKYGHNRVNEWHGIRKAL